MVKSRIDLSAKIKNAILLHHENEDGSGYPKGLKGNQIFIYAKIIHVADVFDALTAKRPYKKAYAQSEAAEYLMGSCDRMFDREVVKAFLQCVSLYPKGTQVQLSKERSPGCGGNKKPAAAKGAYYRGWYGYGFIKPL